MILENREFHYVYLVLFIFNFIFLCSRATSIWYQSLTSIRDQVIILCSLRFSDSNSRPPTGLRFSLSFGLFKFPKSEP